MSLLCPNNTLKMISILRNGERARNESWFLLEEKRNFKAEHDHARCNNDSIRFADSKALVILLLPLSTHDKDSD